MKQIMYTLFIEFIPHPKDSMSAVLWVEEMRQKVAINPVLLYKPQGQKAMNDCQY